MIKTLLKIMLLNLGFFATISCQNEHNLLIEPSSNEIIKANTTITSLLQRMVTHDGSKDNIIDNSDCLSVELPVTVVANGIELTINSETDYALIEAIFNESDDDTDTLNITFPIEIILNDFSNIIINNNDELEDLAKDCDEENDTDIECIDFVYPITFSIYNSSSQLSETLVVKSDEQLYELLEDLEDYYIIQINFPISLISEDETIQSITSMEELETAIKAADEICNDDD
ncbi:MAG: hypothetical protein JJE44_11820 [Flavobacteriaceae bacterium]|nr:hypothetical protein [Flavobacteriaceae bacterium]